MALSGLRVLEVGGQVSAAYATRLLADLGADVIKVEPPDGDETRRIGPFPEDAPHAEKSGLFLHLNANKRGITLNLRDTSGRSSLLRAVPGSRHCHRNPAAPVVRGVEAESW